MKKTLTAALALTAFAGIAFADKATIDTQVAGCLSVTGAASEKLVCNPFNNITNTASGAYTLGDIVGYGDATISVISADAKRLFTVTWNNDGWYAKAGDTVSSNDYPLARGTSIVFSGSGAKLYFSGSRPESANVPKDLTAGKYAAVGNVSVATTGKTLGDFSLVSCDPAKDYVIVAGTKYVYYNSNWYTKTNFMASSFGSNANSTPIDPCEGIAVVCAGNPKRGAARTGLKVNLPGTY